MNSSLARGFGLAALMLGGLAFAITAFGQEKHSPDPADVNAKVPPTRYETFAPRELPAIGNAGSAGSPADNWKTLNQTVAGYDSMSLTTDDVTNTKPDAPPPADAVAPTRQSGETKMPPAQPTRPTDKTTPPDPHAHHRPGGAQ